MNDSCHSSETAITVIRNGVGFMAQSIYKVNIYLSRIRISKICIAPEIFKRQSVFLYNLGRLNDFVGQKCLKLKLRSAFVNTNVKLIFHKIVGLQ